MLDSIGTRRLLQGGILGAIAFLLAQQVLAAVRPGYDPVRHFVSILSLGDGGWLQVINFIVSGLLIAGLGIGLRRRWTAGPGASWVPRLVLLSGLGIAWCGVFLPDPSNGYPPGTTDVLLPEITWHGALHFAGAFAVGAAIAVAGVIGVKRWWLAGRRGLVVASGALALLVLLSVSVVLVARGLPGIAETAGLLERIAIAAGWSWFVLIGVVALGDA